jgi:hypothetical protein
MVHRIILTSTFLPSGGPGCYPIDSAWISSSLSLLPSGGKQV